MKMGIICFILGLPVLAGCAGSDTVRISTESEAAFEKSLEAMHRNLSQEEQLKLMVALLQVRMAGMKSSTEARASTKGRQVLSADELRAIDGLTYTEILKVARLAGADAELMR